MAVRKEKLEDFINAARQIVESQQHDQEKLLFEITQEDDAEIKELTKLIDAQTIEDPDKSYDLFYNGIQAFLLKILPQDTKIRKPILELKSIFLSGKEKENIKYGKRGADSRMSYMERMEDVIDILTQWSQTPNEYLKLAHLFLVKNKELGYIPEDREISDYI
ncbi:hypothetical protein [uncultured Butyricimonas sp.]|uniref:hypothetical protein n=1 Tax=uncultured Butyricimonas sp. TaxID=1268785 RepID=UPI0026DB1166|nr:hypothetical protein [uncultured Butyricimonas sp.]